MRRSKKTYKEGADGRLYHVRDDGRVKLLRREKALAWARRKAPDALERLRAAYDAEAAAAYDVEAAASSAAHAAAATRRRLAVEVLGLLDRHGWTRDPGTSTFVRGSNRTDLETVVALAIAAGIEVVRTKFEELERGDAVPGDLRSRMIR